MKRALSIVALMSLAACGHRSSAEPTVAPSAAGQPAAVQHQMTSHGLAGWVGQEFAGRTTADGEIFDPMLMTASHRTLPFGTLLDVRNPKTGQSVRVRVNDRGPYVGDRLIDLSYAAAQQIGLADGAGGEIDMTVVKMGRGDREPPAAFAVNVPDNSAVAARPATPTPAPVTPAPVTPAPVTPAPMPAPAPVQPQPAPAPAPAPEPATVDRVEVTELHADGTETRRQVSANGRSVEQVPVVKRPAPAPATPAPTRATPQPRPAATHSGRYVVQVGAFSQEGNAKALQQKLKAIGQESTIDHTSLYFVRIGPFATREQAAGVRAKLEAAGISAIITVAQ